MTKSYDPIATAGRDLSRREVLNYIWIGSLALLTVQGAGMGVYYMLPRFRQGEFGGRFKAGRVVELPSAGDPPRNVPEGKFWLVRTKKHLLALYKACTHLDCMFDWNPQESKFICPCHGSQFARDGQLLTGPAPRSLDHFLIQIISPEGEVLAQTDANGGLAMPDIAMPNQPQEGQEAEAPPKATPNNAGIPPESTVWVDTGHKFTGVTRLG
jgi:cytochrome b6-f complex iron-sulfur subunit